ncbi:MAG: PhoH family protein [Nitrospirae bacterium]|nr:PhoH family protein [Nitrospirota bacterium]MBI5696191.1 PhoH family protein [Nitrospirota bacterium]
MTLGHEEGIPVLFGEFDRNLRYIESTSGVDIKARGNRISIEGEDKAVLTVERVINDLAGLVGDGYSLKLEDVKLAMRAHEADPEAALKNVYADSVLVGSNKKQVTPKTGNQKRYVEAIRKHDIVFGVGPAGTGKTYLAMAAAVSALVKKEVNRIILTRPAVEAGEKLGFLPGDIAEKVHPYLRPLYDALYDMMDAEKVGRLVERGTIEIAPLAFMRGRTLNDSFIILDEAQNTTTEQMKMFLTRMGFGSKSVITGDITQVDLPPERASGLITVMKVLEQVKGIEFVKFTEKDVVRHRLVQDIIMAYQKFEDRDGKS